ncbi:MAG: Fatty acid desaturase [Chloroflexi bacterium]|jgi:fatty acid desaturase|nr:MAG: Fatty acid desaturase [Chloroflexota bacterium]
MAAENPALEGPRSSQMGDYAGLRRVVEDSGLLSKQLAYYAFKIVSTLALLALSIAILVLVDTFWVQLLNAGFLAFVFAQIGFIGHDSAHRQIFRSARNNEIASLAICFLLALERSWWIDKHGRHHNNPNHLTLDPDAELPMLAFTEGQALSKRGLYKIIVKRQAFLFYPLLLLEGLGLRLAGLIYILSNKVKYPVAEPLLMISHFAVYFGLLFFFLGAWNTLIFFLVHQGIFGFIVGSAFAPNHKGMRVVADDEELSFLERQVVTSRNVRPNLFTSFWFGGLNFQIEHHLFPSMPRNKLGEARKIVKAFCEANAMPYHETGLVQSQREILGYLHRESGPLRERGAQA